MLDLKLLESFLTWVQNINHARVAEKLPLFCCVNVSGGGQQIERVINTKGTKQRGIRLNAMKRFCVCSL